MSKQKIDVDPQQILAWMKANIVLVVLLVACIGAGIGLPMFAASWSEEVQQSLNKRTKEFSEIDNLFKSSVTPPGGGSPQKVVINRELVEQYREIANMLRDDAQRVVEQAKQHNQKDSSTMFAELFSEDVTRAQLETLPQQFYAKLQSNYLDLLSDLDAGSPLGTDELVLALEEARVRFMENKLSKPVDASLTEEQHSQLLRFMTDRRMSMLRGRAEELGLYLEEETLGIPEFEAKNRPNVGTLFTWQWRYWAVADAFAAISAVNGDQSELTAPIKRVTFIQVLGLPEITAGKKAERNESAPQINERPPSPKRGGGAMGMGGDTSKNPPKSEKPNKPKRDSGRTNTASANNSPVVSFTNRNEATLFDSLQVRLRLIVSTVRIPTILDTFAQNNFATVIDIDLKPVNKFTSLEDGFDYGAEPVSELTVVLETAWLRAWTVELMPESVRSALGI
ncbi:MAG: hypothetical protein H8E91_01955 [Planctomycetes bacterium]|nr:hypothetical protein [Planctomycetota bacterium]